MGFVVPGVLLNFAALVLRQSGEFSDLSVVSEIIVASVSESTEAESEPIIMRLQNSEGSVEQRNMDDYLVGVVLAEMPASFEEEALKAQSVVARTYALKASTTVGKHGNGSVCTQPGCCQAYISEEEYIKNGGTVQSVSRVSSAVERTSGEVLVYDGALIEATYFSCSGGSTEDAVAVWGTDYPYLRSVSSPGEEEAAHYTDTVYFSKADFCAALDIAPEGMPEDWIGEPCFTSGGGIERITIADKSFSGVQLRRLLGLRSTAISMKIEDGGVTVTTKGYGHRVGMSQYGANAMAEAGSMYPEILAHYYGGTELIQWSEKIVGNES